MNNNIMLKDGTNERSYRPCSSRARQVNENEVFVRSGASEASGAERRSQEPQQVPQQVNENEVFVRSGASEASGAERSERRERSGATLSRTTTSTTTS